MPKLAYPTENFLSSNTSQFEINLLAETPDNPFGSSSALICPRDPNVNLSWIASTPLCPTLALRHLGWVCVSLRRPCVSPLALCISNAGLSEALRNSQLPLRGPAWALASSTSLSQATALLSRNYLCLSVSLYSMPLSCNSRSLILSFLANLTLENRMTNHSGVFSKWPSSLLLYFSCWHINDRD